ncbi:MAG: methyl-accepting chemotaxis protein [Phycisphaerales bacterium]
MINTAYVRTLSGRLLVFGVLPTLLAIGVIVGLTAVETRRQMLAEEERLLSETAQGAATEFNFRNERWNNVAMVMSLAQTNGLFGRRKAGSDFAREVNAIFPLVVGAYFAYEPNADGQDAASLKSDELPREAMDANGRFVPYWRTEGGKDVLRPRTGMEKLESYQKPKREFETSGKAVAVVSEPAVRDGMALVTHSFPIVIKNQFAGAAGVDRDMEGLAQTVDAMKARLGADVFVVSPGGVFLAASTDKGAASESDRLVMKEVGRSPFAPLAESWRGGDGTARYFEAADPVLGEACLYATHAVATGGWNVIVRRSKSEAMTAVNAALVRNVGVGTIGLLVVGGLLFGVSRSVSQRVRRAGIRLYSTATEIGATSRQQEASASTFGAASNQIAAAVKEISATGQDLVRTMESVNENAVETADLASTGRTGLKGMESVMHDLDRATASISDKLGAINERSQKITAVITTITKVADQTNILSINAAIEAEKAGEFGSGFLVIAREIRRLADQTASATLDIEQMVKQMQGAVSAGVMEMDRFADQVRRGVHEVSTAGLQLTEIIDRVNRSTESFKLVNESMQAQSQGAQQISEAMTSLTGNAQQTVQSAKEFGAAATDLQGAILMLREAVGEFKE